jgi:DNA-binding HxlR family transcriptional regulator
LSELPGAPIANASLAVDLLRVDLNRSLLAALARGRMTQSELKARLVLASGSGLHRHLRQLRRLGLVEKRGLAATPRRVEHGLTGAGEALAGVAEAVEAWLRRHPERPEELTGGPGWRAFLAFNEAWRSALLGRVAGSPRGGRELLAGVPISGEEKLHRDLRLLTGVGLL